MPSYSYSSDSELIVDVLVEDDEDDAGVDASGYDCGYGYDAENASVNVARLRNKKINEKGSS